MTEQQSAEIVLRNQGLFYTIANKHGPIGSSYDENDIAQEMFIDALKAVKRDFDPSAGSEQNFLSLVGWRTTTRLRKRAKKFASGVLEHDIEIPVADNYFRELFEDFRDRLAQVSEVFAETVMMLYEAEGNIAKAARMHNKTHWEIKKELQRIRQHPIGVDIAACL